MSFLFLVRGRGSGLLILHRESGALVWGKRRNVRLPGDPGNRDPLVGKELGCGVPDVLHGTFLLLFHEPTHRSLSRDNESTRYRGKQVGRKVLSARNAPVLTHLAARGVDFNANKKAPPGGCHVNGHVSISNRAEDHGQVSGGLGGRRRYRRGLLDGVGPNAG